MQFQWSWSSKNCFECAFWTVLNLSRAIEMGLVSHYNQRRFFFILNLSRNVDEIIFRFNSTTIKATHKINIRNKKHTATIYIINTVSYTYGLFEIASRSSNNWCKIIQSNRLLRRAGLLDQMYLCSTNSNILHFIRAFFINVSHKKTDLFNTITIKKTTERRAKMAWSVNCCIFWFFASSSLTGYDNRFLFYWVNARSFRTDDNVSFI